MDKHGQELDRTGSASTTAGSMVETTELTALGYRPELRRNRSMLTLLFQSLAIAAIPYGEGAPILSAVVGGGPLSIFLGWIVSRRNIVRFVLNDFQVVCVLDECVAVSLGELASRYPTSAGPYYWSFQIAHRGKTLLSYITGFTYLVGNWCITLSVNFGFASLLVATIAIYKENWIASAWELLLIFYAICVFTLLVCAFGNRLLPLVDAAVAAFTAITIVVVLVALSIKADAGRHTASYALGYYDTSFSGWGGFTFFIGLLPAAYTFSAIGMISSMAEEVADPTRKVPVALSLCVPVGGIAGLFFILPICFTLPPLRGIISESPYSQALP